jgi:hypothetical protein
MAMRVEVFCSSLVREDQVSTIVCQYSSSMKCFLSHVPTLCLHLAHLEMSNSHG